MIIKLLLAIAAVGVALLYALVHGLCLLISDLEEEAHEISLDQL